MADWRGAAITALLVLVAGALALAAAPFDLAAVRFAGVGLLWWYTTLVAPAVALAIAILVFLAAPRE